MSFKNDFKHSSDIKIGIIGPQALVDQTKKTLKGFPNFKPVIRMSDSENDISNVAKELMDDVDVLLFTEYHLYEKAKQTIDFKIPVHHVPLMGTGLYRSLALLQNSSDSNHLSLDTIEVKYVEQILSELNEKQYTIATHHKQTAGTEIEQMVDFHVKNYVKNKAVALTGIQEVSELLTKRKVPHQWVIPTQQDMIVSLERALLATSTRRNKESQIVLGIINIDNFKGVVEHYHSEHDIQILKLTIQQLLLNYIRHLDGHLINLGGEEYSFITTRGIFERETRGYKFIPLLQDAKSNVGITLSIGVGFGRTAAEAGNHARLALRQAKDVGGNVCYIVREDKSVIGPVDITTHTQYERYDLAITDAELIKRAEMAGMSASYMTKLMARVARHRKFDYTAQELASTLNITIRSAHRILLKWMDAQIVEIVGEEKLTHKGRPRRIYRLSFIAEEMNENVHH